MLNKDKIQTYINIILKYSSYSPRQIAENYGKYHKPTTFKFSKNISEFTKEEIDFFKVVKEQYNRGMKTWNDVLDNQEERTFSIHNPEFAIAFIQTYYSSELKEIINATSLLSRFKTNHIYDNMRKVENVIEKNI